MVGVVPLLYPRNCAKTLCPAIDNYLYEEMLTGFDTLSLSVLALARKYKTHIITVRDDMVSGVSCDTSDKWLEDIAGRITEVYNDVTNQFRTCQAIAWENAERASPDEVVRALKECVRRLVADLSRLDEGFAKAIGEFYMGRFPHLVSKVLKASPRAGKIERLINEINVEAKPLHVSMLEKALMKELGSWATVISVYDSPTERTMVVVEDGKARTLEIGALNTMDVAIEAYSRLSAYFPDVFRIGCGDCRHANLVRLVKVMRKDPNFQLFAKLVVWHLLSDKPQGVRERIAKVVNTPEALHALISITHSAEVGHLSIVDHVGDTPICVSVLTCEVSREFLDGLINDLASEQ